MFIFLFCCIGPRTPPVALAAYSASGLAGSDPNRTGFTAFRMGFAAFIIPFLFAYKYELLLIGSPFSIIGFIIVTMIGIILLVMAIEGYLTKRLSWGTRGILFALAAVIFVLQSIL
jgi:TRAP-type uncharacterized transport system fused permease subunit